MEGDRYKNGMGRDGDLKKEENLKMDYRILESRKI